MSALHARSEAIQTALDKVRATRALEKESPAFVDGIKSALVELTKHTDLFTIEAFPIKRNTHAGMYRLGQDADGSNALYITGGIYGKVQTRPHRHTSWVAMGGVVGKETNRIYERTDDGSVPGQGTLQPKEIVDVLPGEATLIPTGLYHTLEVHDDLQSLHFHLYDEELAEANAALEVFDSPTAGTLAVPKRSVENSAPGVHPTTFGELSEALRANKPIVVVTVDHEDSVLASIARPHALTLADLPGSAKGLEPDAGTPVVLAGDVSAVERAAKYLSTLGFSYFAHLR